MGIKSNREMSEISIADLLGTISTHAYEVLPVGRYDHSESEFPNTQIRERGITIRKANGKIRVSLLTEVSREFKALQERKSKWSTIFYQTISAITNSRATGASNRATIQAMRFPCTASATTAKNARRWKSTVRSAAPHTPTASSKPLDRRGTIEA